MTGLCLTAVLLSGAGAAFVLQDEWQFRPGVLLVTNSRLRKLKDVNAQILSVGGFRRIARAEVSSAAVYHALIFYPEAPVVGGGGGSSNRGPVSNETLIWILRNDPPDGLRRDGDRSLEIRYHALDRTITVGSQTFSAEQGNLFIVRLNDEWLPDTVQVASRHEEQADAEKALGYFKSALPQDASVQKLELIETE